MKIVLPDSQESLVQWISQATGISTFGVKVRLRGNDLHILCESVDCPQRWHTLSDLLQALQQTDLDVLTNREQSSIYQVFVYGRKKGEVRPQWCHRVYLNQLERHLEQVNQILLADTSELSQPPGVLVVSNESLARQGDPDAIARYLSETLSNLGVAVQVQVKPQNSTDTENSASPSNRLWVFCASGYTPDPSLIAEPVAQKLRSLELSGYQDAIIAAQVQGESQPDWLLRIDLTPPEVMLKEWARWGDMQAITSLLSQKFAQFRIRINTSLQESILHIFCTPINQALKTALAPTKELCLRIIKSELEAIAPQGITAASVYGQQTTQSQPEWVDWLNLPAQEHDSFQPSALELAGRGDEPAIVFLLERLLNPNLDVRLQTGGLRVILLRKDDLLHIMCDAPVCPGRKRVCKTVAKFLQQLAIPGIGGVRIYGRRAGNKEPFWHYGVDFYSRQRLVPEATPEFAATSAYVGDLIPIPNAEPVIRPDVTNQEVKNFVGELVRGWGKNGKNLLLKTQLFTEINQPQEKISIEKKHWVGLIWGSLGLLLTFQTDLLLSQMVTRSSSSNSVITPVSASSLISNAESSPEPTNKALLPNSRDIQSSKEQVAGFNYSVFTSKEVSKTIKLKASPRKKSAKATATILAARNRKHSFNSWQLDEQLALYRQKLTIKGKPPQVLIIGSSRALRGIDPVALSRGLATQGYTDIDVFNFGINGATVQVVDFILRHVLKPTELPKLMIWADGSRAFNSGREDATFKAIASSPGYKHVLQQSAATPNQSLWVNNSHPASNNKFNPQGYTSINESLNQVVAEFSATYQNRDQLKQALNQTLSSLPVIKTLSSQNQSSVDVNKQTEPQLVDFDGFLPLSKRFNPSEYYQKHPKVSGTYDNDYQSFRLLGIQDAALQSVLNFSQQEKITIVFVNMPLSQEYLDPVRTKYEQEFQQYMLSFVAHPNFVYRDLSQLWPKGYDFFSDPSHLNRYGAYEVSKKLAHDPMIPWRKN
ncbi:DUF1574 family protein [Calothrix rhizosoleniae]|uniref:DUF1574 family protein n=1 Tax=Calothrix rhizosoleniae TaxID=888997 RepID=UPI000B498CD3|nr:DUF1574 family protein [Calothrix rhizosoleniae]